MNVLQRLASLLSLMAAVMIAAAEGDHTFSRDHASYLDAVYVAVITIATVLCAEVIATGHNPPLRISMCL